MPAEAAGLGEKRRRRRESRLRKLRKAIAAQNSSTRPMALRSGVMVNISAERRKGKVNRKENTKLLRRTTAQERAAPQGSAPL